MDAHRLKPEVGAAQTGRHGRRCSDWPNGVENGPGVCAGLLNEKNKCKLQNAALNHEYEAL